MNVWTYLLYRWKNIIFVYNFYLLGLLKNFIMIRRVVRGKKTNTIFRVSDNRYFSLIPNIWIFRR